MSAPAKPLTEQTPVEIDTQLAAIYDEIHTAQSESDRVERILDDYRDGVEKRRAGDYGYFGYTDEGLDQLEARYQMVNGEVTKQRARCVPFNEEFRRRGGWTRAFLVRNSNGHVHSSMDCDTCFMTTVFAWLPEYSGRDTEEIITAAGWRACSRCYPGAPTDDRTHTSLIEDPQKRAAREERERKAAERAAKAAITGISNPDGTPLEVPRWSGRREELRTERTAETYAVKILTNKLASLRYGHEPAIEQHDVEALDLIVAALAHKRGQSVEDALTHVTEKAEAKHRRNFR